MNRVLQCMFICLAVLAMGTHAMAGNGAELFLKKCMHCHSKSGKAGPISPADKSSSVWGK